MVCTPSWLPSETTDWRPTFRRSASACLCANDFPDEPKQLAIERRSDCVRRWEDCVPVALHAMLALLAEDRPDPACNPANTIGGLHDGSLHLVPKDWVDIAAVRVELADAEVLHVGLRLCTVEVPVRHHCTDILEAGQNTGHVVTASTVHSTWLHVRVRLYAQTA